jgi:hypothetical protein
MIKLLDILNESYNPNIYQVNCKVVIGAGNRPITDIISDIRAIPGVTIVDTIESDYKTTEGRHVIELSLKIDPSPFNPFNSASYDEILSNIKKLPDVRGAQFTTNPIVTEHKLQKLIKEVLQEKEDRCKRIADKRYDKPSAYKSGAIVRCRKGNIWKDLKEDESLHKWFKRQGPKGKEGGWVDCNAPDGKGGYKSCGRKEGEKRSKYPSCRPTPDKCKSTGKGKKWGKTK